jgi:leucine dehydrogenase
MEPERIVRLHDAASGLDGFLVIHSLRFGPAFGGIRIWNYSSEDECLADAQRLAEAMTYKTLMNDIPGAGGKIVINQSSIVRRPDAMRALARAINSQEGKFYTGGDLGITRDDLRVLGEFTTYLSCQNLSPFAAQGVLKAIRTIRPELKGLHVAIQGLGSVGGHLARALFKEGARLTITDIRRETCKELSREVKATIVPTDEIHKVSCDVFAPCAVGGILNSETIPQLHCEIVCGGANNQIAEEEDARRLHERNILYVPDFLANSGAAIVGCWTILKGPGDYTPDVLAIGDRLERVLGRARSENISLDAAARAIVRDKLRA